MRDLSAGNGSSDTGGGSTGGSGRHGSTWAGPVLLLTLGLLLGSSGCAANDAETDGGGGPGSQRVSFLPGEPVSTALPTTAPGTSAAARAIAGATPHPATTAPRQLKRTPGAGPATHAAAARTTQARRSPTPGTGPGARFGAESATAAAAAAPDFLPLGACAAAGPSAGAYRPVRCDAMTAVARVVGRLPAGGSVAACPPATDVALQLSTTTGSGSGTTTRPSGIACLRNLRSPHPGDPGGGGGIGIVPGDCLYRADGTRVLETACDGSGPQAADYRVGRLVAEAGDCPAGTGGYISVRNPGAPEQTACAALLRHG